jgi:O-antigen/teichoic acid export membrane protein
MSMDVVAIFVGIGLSSAVYRFYYKFDAAKDRNLVISTVFFLLIGLYLFASSLIFVLDDQLSFLIFGCVNYSYHVKLISLCFFFQAFLEVPFIFLKTIQSPVHFVIVNVFKLILQLSLNIYLVVFMHLGIFGVLYSTLITEVCVGGWLVFFTYRLVGYAFSPALAKGMLAFGAPLIIADLCDFVLTFSDRYFLRIYQGLDEVGIYSLGYKLGFVLWALVMEPVLSIWLPQRFKLARGGSLFASNEKVFFYVNFLVIFTALGISLFSKDFFRIMSNKEFWRASDVVPIIMLAYIVQAWTALCNFGIFYSGKTKYRAIGAVFSAIVMVAFCFMLVPAMGMYGAGLATLMAFFVRFLIIYYYSQREFPLSYEWRKNSIVLLVSVVVFAISWFFKSDTFAISVTYNILFIFLFLIICFLLPIFSNTEKKYMTRLILSPVSSIKLIIKG